MIFLPPRHSKSQLVSRHFPAFVLGHHPEAEIISCSYSAALASRLCRDVQRLICDPSYQHLFPATRLLDRQQTSRKKLAIGQRTSQQFDLAEQSGSYRGVGVGGSITGMGFLFGIIDDPVKNAKEALSALSRDRIWEWYQSTFWTRQSPGARILLTMTRWHMDDLAGRLLKQEEYQESWTVLSLPAIAEKIRHPSDQRQFGEALWPQRFSLSWLEQAQRSLGNHWFSAMYQQRPVPATGNRFREQWFRRYRCTSEGWSLAELGEVDFRNGILFGIIDPATSTKASADFTAIGIFAITPHPHLLILEMIQEKMDIEMIVPRLEQICRGYELQWLGIEANGFQIGLVREARRNSHFPPIRELKPAGKSKLVRAIPAIIRAESGQIWVPEQASWLSSFFDELTHFTGLHDSHDDQVDVLSYAVDELIQFQGAEEGTAKTSRLETDFPRFHGEAQQRGLWGL